MIKKKLLDKKTILGVEGDKCCVRIFFKYIENYFSTYLLTVVLNTFHGLSKVEVVNDYGRGRVDNYVFLVAVAALLLAALFGLIIYPFNYSLSILVLQMSD